MPLDSLRKASGKVGVITEETSLELPSQVTVTTASNHMYIYDEVNLRILKKCKTWQIENVLNYPRMRHTKYEIVVVYNMH